MTANRLDRYRPIVLRRDVASEARACHPRMESDAQQRSACRERHEMRTGHYADELRFDEVILAGDEENVGASVGKDAACKIPEDFSYPKTFDERGEVRRRSDFPIGGVHCFRLPEAMDS